MIPLFKVFMNDEVINDLNKTLLSGYISQGKKVEEFESKLKKLFDYEYILTLNSATSAMTLALRLINEKFNKKPTNEVLAVPLTCMATNLPILANNMKIKWADVDPNNGLIDLKDIEKKINKKN